MVKLINSWGGCVREKQQWLSKVSGGENYLKLRGVIFFEEKIVGCLHG